MIVFGLASVALATVARPARHPPVANLAARVVSPAEIAVRDYALLANDLTRPALRAGRRALRRQRRAARRAAYAAAGIAVPAAAAVGRTANAMISNALKPREISGHVQLGVGARVH